jgi:hypothetical protein
MSTVAEDLIRPVVVGADEADPSCFVDVVGLRIPRKRVLATVEIAIDARELPRRKPHVRVPPGADEGAL